MTREKCIMAIQHHPSLGHILKPYRARYEPRHQTWKITHNYMDVASLSKEDLQEESHAEQQVIFLAREYRQQSLRKSFGPSAEEIINTNKQKKGTQQLSLAKKHVLRYVQSKVYKIITILRDTDIPLLYKESPDIREPVKTSLLVHQQPAHVNFHFVRHPEGIDYSMGLFYQGKAVPLKGKQPVLLSGEPCAIVIDQELFVLESVPAERLLPFFEKDHIHVPERLQEGYMKGFIAKTLRDNPVTCEGFSVKTHTGNPELMLQLTKNLSGQPAVKLQYRYGKHIVLPSDSKKNLVFFYGLNAEHTYHKYIRNTQLERKAIDILRDMGLSGNDEVFFTPGKGEHAGNDLVSWINLKYRLLQEAGFQVFTGSDMPSYHLGSVFLESKVVEQSIDWFDIHAVVWVGDTALPFICLRDTILSGKRTYRLPCGTLFVLPAHWLTSFKELMYYSRPVSGVGKSQMKLHKHHLGLVKGAGLWEKGSLSSSLEALYSSQPDTTISPPKELKANLRSYQLEGLAWLRHLHKHQLGGCLADDMGLGKTVQTLALLTESIKNYKPSKNNQTQKNKPQPVPASLIIMPTSLIHNWHNEIKKFAPHLKTLIYKDNRQQLSRNFHQYHVILTSYGIARNDASILKSYTFHYIVLDESQFIKNPSSKTYQAITLLSAQYRLVLTGTPIENSLTDLWAQFNFLNHGMLGTRNQFNRKYYGPVEKEKNLHAERALRHLISPFILRRKKMDVAQELPPVTEQLIQCEMTREQQDAYDRYKSAVRNSLIGTLTDNNLRKKQVQVLEAILRLRQMCNHPLLANPSYQGSSGKMDEVLSFTHSLVAQGHKGLFFSSFTTHLSLLAKELDQREYPYVMLTGSTINREKVVERFEKDEGPMLFLISLKAGGTGLNLTAAEYVFLLDPWWNPASEMQAISRAHRIGQNKKVFVYRFIAKNSIEDKIFSLQKRKKDLAHSLINDSSPFKKMTSDQIKELFG